MAGTYLSNLTGGGGGGGGVTTLNSLSGALTLTGASGINVTDNGTDTITITLGDTAVAPGSYTNTNITVDQQGRITAISNGTAGIAAVVDDPSPHLGGDLITNNLYIRNSGTDEAHLLLTNTTSELSSTGVLSLISTGGDIVISANGVVQLQSDLDMNGSAITNATTITADDIVANNTFTLASETGILIADGSGVVTGQVLTGDVNTVGNVATLANTAVVAGNYTSVDITVDAAGRITAASNGVGTNAITALTGDATATGPGSAALTLATVNADVGTFNTLTVNAKGLVTAASNTAYLTANQTITLSGDVTGSGATAITTTLANTAVTPGSYTNTSLTVDSKGRITAASSGTAGLSTTLTSAHLFVGNGSNVATDTAITGDVTLSNTGVTTLANTAVSAGSYTSANITVDAKGRITAAANGSAGGITALTGDVTASGSGSVAATIANNAVTNAKAAQMAAYTLKGNNTGSTANSADLTVTQAGNMLQSTGVTTVASSGSSQSPDFLNIAAYKITLTANCTINTPTNMIAGGAYVIELIQDGTGSRTITATWLKWPGGVAPTLSTAAGAIDLIAVYFNGTNYYGSSSLNNS